MSYQEYNPCPLLQSYVECYWTQKASQTQVIQAPRMNKILPDGCVDILFQFNNEFSNLKNHLTAHIVGTMTSAIDIPVNGSGDILAIRFHPGGTLPFLKTSVHEFTDQCIALTDVLGFSAIRLIDELRNTKGIKNQIAIIESFLLQKLNSSKFQKNQIYLVVHSILENHHNGRIEQMDQLISILGRGSRQIERIFYNGVGIGPKMFLRVKRFQNIDHYLKTNKGTINWANLAAQYGYFDQSHLIRDCKSFTGLSPVNYQKFLKMSDFSNPIQVDSDMD